MEETLAEGTPVTSNEGPLFISIVVPTRNRVLLLRDCLDSLLLQDYPADRYEVIVVDDGSKDEAGVVASELSRRSTKPVVKLVSQPPRGLNAARNSGVQVAVGGAICFIDDDELAPPGYLATLARVVREAVDFDGYGGPYVGRTSGRLSCSKCSLGSAEMSVDAQGEVSWLFGGNMAIRAAALAKVGTFDEEILGIGDEAEWFHRAKAMGFRFLYSRDLWVWHRRDQQSVLDLCRIAFSQGLAVPVFRRKVGAPERPSLAPIFRYLGHTLLRRCAGGLVLASRHLGWLVGYMRQT